MNRLRPELFIARRLSPSHSDGREVPVGVRIGVIGVALSFVIMLLSLAVVTGFKQEIRRKVLGYESQIMISGRDVAESPDSLSAASFNTVRLSSGLRGAIGETLGDVSIGGVADMPVLLKTDSAFSAMILRCVDDGYDRTFINEAVVSGRWTPADSGYSTVAISRATASQLGLNNGDRVFAHFFRNGSLVTRRLTVGAVYDTHFDDYDRHFAFGEYGLARSVAHLPDSTYTSLAITGLPDRYDTSLGVASLSSRLVSDALASGQPTTRVPAVKDIRQTGALYLNWLELLDTNVTVIITLMSVVAGFTLISSLIILILERVAMIGLLKAIGATNRQIRSIFVFLAEKIVLSGLAWGNGIGLTVYFVQHNFHIIPLNPEAYYLSYVPTQLGVSTFLILNAGVVAGSLLTLVLPTQIISRMSPAGSLRRQDQTE